ncbi:hypothetical protein C5167_051207, partial [Papaver somniferum]
MLTSLITRQLLPQIFSNYPLVIAAFFFSYHGNGRYSFQTFLLCCNFAIFLIFYVSKVAVAGKLFPALGLDPVQLGLRKEKFNHFRVYWHDNAGVSNPTTIQVAGANSTQDSITGFGAILVFDDALTEGSDPSSKRLGRAQGTYTFAGIDEPVVLVNANIVFTTGKYNGSTLGIMGRNMLVPEVRELIIIG